MRLRSLFLLLSSLLALPFLAGCTDDAASYMIDGRYHSLSLAREQPYFWESKVRYYLVVTRLPNCQRKHFVLQGNPLAKTELWEMGGGTYLIRQGTKMFVTETRTCEGFAPLLETPAEGLGTKLGVFFEKDGFFKFKPADPAPPAAETPAAATETPAPAAVR